jgi:hypothetical protein
MYLGKISADRQQEKYIFTDLDAKKEDILPMSS